MENHTSDIKVSICCITYNHEKYIAKAIEGFLNQKTSFKYEILIGEDCSTDNTLAVINDYIKRFPGQIKLITGDKNIGSIRNLVRVFAEVQGKYIAFCDGDDYWTDPLKIQKQVDFLENNLDYTLCFHYSEVVDSFEKTIYVSQCPKPLSYTYKDFLIGRRDETRIGTMMVVNSEEVRNISKNDWYYTTNGTDAIFKLYATAVTGGKGFVLPEVMSCYRIHAGGVWSMINSKVKKKKMLSDFKIVINNFKYSSFQKRELLKIYMKKYFFFEIRNFRLNSVLHTLSTLL
ncbi:glycosyltransferase [Desertivirga xinjiangensis]|uniref:glycosyltransferase n=1 Tax=Desertivirga xinjiangensis TaxID=539206 RepID=UPI00210C234B|nr:glycosyltransferase [Pedobacter xinjiangensis]